MRALLVSYEFPPRIGTGSGRLLGLALALRDAGWRVRVVTVRSLRPAMRAAYDAPDPPGVEVLRVPALAAPVYQLAARAPRLAALLDGVHPVDFAAPWAVAAAAAATASLARRPADVVLGSGPPFSGVVAAAAAARATRTPLVVDLRDPWVGNPLFARPADAGPLGRPLRALDARLEAACVGAAARVLVTAQGLADELAARHGRPVDVVRNGWRQDVRDATAAAPAPPGARPMRWLYPGAVIPGTPYTPAPLLEALGRLVDAGRLRPDAVEVRLLTSHPGEFDGLRRAHPGLRLDVGPFLPRAQALVAYGQTDAFVLGYPDYPGVPGKAYEFMAAGRPVLLLAPPGETRGLLERAGVAVEVPPEPAAAEAAVLRVVEAFRRGEPLVRPDPAFADGFRQEAQLARAVELLGEAARG